LVSLGKGKKHKNCRGDADAKMPPLAAAPAQEGFFTPRGLLKYTARGYNGTGK